MAEKKDSAGKDGKGDLPPPLSRAQTAWLRRHETQLVQRMDTMIIADYLVQKRSMDMTSDIYQRIESQTTIPNERARLRLKFIGSQCKNYFWDFQDALGETNCSDIAITRANWPEVERSFSAEELTAAFYSSWKKGRPASVVKVNQKLKELYRSMTTPSLDASAESEPISLDDIHVNVCLLSADKLSALCGRPGQREPFGVKSLKKKASSFISMENMFKKPGFDDRNLASGIAGSGKSMAFMQKAPHEWSKEDRDQAFWGSIGLLFTGSLTDWDWWKAEQLAQVFGLSRFDLTKEEEDEVVRYIKSHSEEVLLVADSMDEARVDKRSLLWQVLIGKCADLPRLKVIVCSRPCEVTLLLSKHGLFQQRLEVVGFTEEKVGEFVEAFFRQHPQKARELRAQLAGHPDANALMHTPLLATMICRLFQLDKALPRTQTELYEAAVLSMLQQTTERAMERTPENIFDKLSSPHLQATMENLCQLAYEGLAKKQVVFMESQLSAAGCLAAAADLGFLSSSPGVKIPGRGENAYAFQHHTMLEFFAAVHAVREFIRKSKKSVGELVDELGIDGDYARFWPFVSGLLSGPESESLLSALTRKLEAVQSNHPEEISQGLLLLLHCHGECAARLPRDGSPAVSSALQSVGMKLACVHITEHDARSVARVLRQYHFSVKQVTFENSSMDDSSMSIIVAALQECKQLVFLKFTAADITANAPGIIRVLELNKDTLLTLNLPLGDHNLSDFAHVIQKCSQLASLSIGSPVLTDASAAAVADILRQQSCLRCFGLTGGINDNSFASITPHLRKKATQLEALILRLTWLSVPVLHSTLSPLIYLMCFQLVRNPIGDAGFKKLAPLFQRMATLEVIQLFDVGLTWRSLAEIEKLLGSLPSLRSVHVICKKSAFLPVGSGEDVDVTQLISKPLKIVSEMKYRESFIFFGFLLTEQFVFNNEVGSRKLVIQFFA